MFNTDYASFLWQGWHDPSIRPFCQLHVCALYLFAGEAFFEMQIEADKRKDDRDGLAGFVCILRCKGIDNVLM